MNKTKDKSSKAGSNKDDKYDINVEQVSFNKKKGHQSSELVLKFTGKDCNFKILSTLRRVCSNNVPIHAFNPSNIDIQENTCVAFNNDYMKLRLSQLPLFKIESKLSFLHNKYWKNINFADTNREKHPEEKNIKIYINSHNNSNEIKPVTTKDIKVYIDDEQVEMYDPETPILIIFLRPNDTFKCMMIASLAVGDAHSIYCACANAWATYDDEVKDNGDTVFNKGELFLKSRGSQSEYSILDNSSEYLVKKFGDLKIEIDRKVKSKEIDNSSDVLVLVLDDEDHTIGEVLNYEVQDLALFSAVSKPDHNIKSVTLKIETDGKKKPSQLIDEACDVLIGKFKTIQAKCAKLGK
jgi:DNA-directed RNA polymerase subunit L